MKMIRCWMMDRPETARDVEIEDEEDAFRVADDYAAKYNRCEAGDISFVETDRGQIWRVECAMGRPLILLMTARVKRDEALAEIRALNGPEPQPARE